MKYSNDKGGVQVCSPHYPPLLPTITLNIYQKHHQNLPKAPMGLENLPAEGPEPGQVIGVVDVVSNRDNLVETLYLNTHHLQDTKE